MSLRVWKVDLGDDALALRGVMDKNLKQGKSTSKPIGKFDLFQADVPREFKLLLGRSEAWEPPIVDRKSVSWTGVADRMELMKSLSGTVNINGQDLSETEVTYCVLVLEYMESQMQVGRWEPVVRCGVDLLRRFPNLTLAYWKTGIAFIALTLPYETSSFLKHKAKMKENIDENDTKFNKPKVVTEASHFFRCAVSCEPNNRHLACLIDLVLRYSTGIAVPKSHRYRDIGLFPRSLGDAVAIALIEVGQMNVEQTVSQVFRHAKFRGASLEDEVATSVLFPNTMEQVDVLEIAGQDTDEVSIGRRSSMISAII